MTSNPHILYIEDNEYNHRLVKKLLQPAGFELSTAFDGIQGIKRAIELNPDLILMDLALPNVDGLGATAKIKSVAGLEKVPVIALTSQRTKRDRQRALVAGCDGYIDKPIDAATFADQVRTYLEGKRDSTDIADRNRILKDFNVQLVDQLQGKVEELEQANSELLANKEELRVAYEQSQKSNLELQRLNLLKGNIVSITSHELRTPLSVAKGYIEVILEGMMGEINESQVQVLEIARQRMDKMGELIDKITDLNRLALKKFPMNLEELDLKDVFREVYHDLSFFMKIRKLTLVDELQDEKVMVLADKNLMHQVFSNLLRNAICFTPDGGSITVSNYRKEGKAYFQVDDTGIGIPAEDLRRIFDEFYQVQDVTHHKTGHFEYMTRGIGVGLALCKGILSELGGRIWAESTGSNQGSSFTFYLPMVNQE